MELLGPGASGLARVSLSPSGLQYGEASGLPVRIRRAEFSVHPAPAIGQHLIQLELTVVNEVVQEQISAKLRVPLPPGATVCRFQFHRDGLWFPAVPVEAKQARDIVYKEREKGRRVAAAAQAQGNIFEIEVFPLAHGCPARCRLWYTHEDGVPALSFDDDTEVVGAAGAAGAAGAGGPAAPPRPGTEPGACVGECFGESHFACFVPHLPADAAEAAPGQLAVLWDTSGSQSAADHGLRFERLRQLAARCPRTRFEVWTFGIGFQQVLASATAAEAIAALSAVSYDGGTDLGSLPALLDALAPADAILLFSDGMDNLDRRPQVGTPRAPIHCVADQPAVNLPCLNALCLATGGQLLRGDYLPLLRPATLVTRIETDQSDEDFMEGGDGFRCCPDHRLQMQWPVGEAGLWLCGTRGAVRRLTVELRAGGITKRIDFDLAGAAPLAPGAAPLLGYLYAQQQYAAVLRDGAAMGLELAAVRADLAVRYGFCSPEASLLMLYEPAQFVENGVDCPEDHPVHSAWKALRAAGAAGSTEGDLGQPKTADQMQAVAKLAEDLRQYMRQPLPPAQPAKKLRGMMPGLGCAGGSRPRTGGADREAARGGGPRARRSLGAAAAAPAAARLEACDSEDDSCCQVEESRGRGASDSDGDAAEAAVDSLGSCFSISSIGNDDAGCLERAGAAAAAAGAGKGKGKGGGKGAPPAEGAPAGGARVDCEAYVAGKEQAYLPVLQQALRQGNFSEVYASLRAQHGASPSFFLYAAGLLLDHAPGRCEEAVRICTNCLEMSIQDVQLMRSVAYTLMKGGQMELAVAVFDRVQDLAPTEPQSFLDGALARGLVCLQGRFSEDHLRRAAELCAAVVLRRWADRFREVEWPALVLLHLLAEVGEARGLGGVWPLDAGLRVPGFAAGLVVWLGWDTDHTDIDLHVVEPGGNEVYYSNNRSSIGGRLSRDFTDGYGPEVYLLKDPPAGTYAVRAKYYASHQQSTLTGSTSAVVWAMQGGATPSIQYDAVRLDRNKEKMEVMAVAVRPGAQGAPHEAPVVPVVAGAPAAQLGFTDTDGDEVVLVREGGGVNEYVNGKLQIQGVRTFAIDEAARTYADDTGCGTFRASEDVAGLQAQCRHLFGLAPEPLSRKAGRLGRRVLGLAPAQRGP